MSFFPPPFPSQSCAVISHWGEFKRIFSRGYSCSGVYHQPVIHIPFQQSLHDEGIVIDFFMSVFIWLTVYSSYNLTQPKYQQLVFGLFSCTQAHSASLCRCHHPIHSASGGVWRPYFFSPFSLHLIETTDTGRKSGTRSWNCMQQSCQASCHCTRWSSDGIHYKTIKSVLLPPKQPAAACNIFP